jgi:hypothetical protein
MKTIKINRYHNKRGNSYSTRDEQECIDIICKKLKIQSNPKIDADYFKNIDAYLKIEKQVNEQYNCNFREINFNINI